MAGAAMGTAFRHLRGLFGGGSVVGLEDGQLLARSVGSGPDRESELAALLHEEIDRLPEGHRLPVVLCDLEGLTYEEAARQLNWTVPTLRTAWPGPGNDSRPG
jgi:DNA-directed RNA polymerase specialized sigma24 family protein